jgi:hypothetical protein
MESGDNPEDVRPDGPGDDAASLAMSVPDPTARSNDADAAPDEPPARPSALETPGAPPARRDDEPDARPPAAGFVHASEAAEPPSFPPHAPRARAGAFRNLWAFLVSRARGIGTYFTYEPTFLVVLGPALLLTTILYSRVPTTNYIFDEQEALLANPYVNQVGFIYHDAIYRDFWGLPPNGSIGSYRPIPNYLWRGVVEVGERLQPAFDYVVGHLHLSLSIAAAAFVLAIAFFARRLPTRWFLVMLGLSAVCLGSILSMLWYVQLPKIDPLTEVGTKPFLQHLYNLVGHAINGALFSAIAWRYSKKRFVGWTAGAVFITAAILTEAVCGCVGLADVLGGMGALLALAALSMRAYAMPFAVFLAVSIGLFSKESAVVCVPLVPFAALLSAPIIHPERPQRVARAALALAGAAAAFVLYVECRKRWFPSPLPSELTAELPPFANKSQVLVRDFLVWFHQPPLPHDPLNNPLADPRVGPDFRVAGALRVYERGVSQVIFPWSLSGDYSSPQEPVPQKLIFFGSVWGSILTLVPLGASLGLAVVGWKREIAGPRGPIEQPEDLPPIGKVWSMGTLLRSIAIFAGAYVSVILTGLPITSWQVALGAIILGVLTTVPRVRVPLFELAVVAVSILLVRKMLSIPDSPEMPSTPDPTAIMIGVGKLRHYGLILGAGSLLLGVAVELSWKAKTRSRELWAISATAIGLVWLVVSYFPHSNIPALLPTVRAERLWYFPVLGTTMVIAVAIYFATKHLRARGLRTAGAMVPIMFLGFQAFRAYWHATDYRDDLAFWKATKDAVPNSSKAHLNYSVMVGAHTQDYETRLKESYRAMQLAPDWAMAHVYTGDTLCRMHRAEEAWPHYRDGFDKGPNDKSLISLGLQCMWDERVLKNHDAELRKLAADHPGSWIAYLAVDTLENGDKNGGVDPQYRPRSYNEGAKKKTTATATATEETSTADTSADESATIDTDDLEPAATTRGSDSADDVDSGAAGSAERQPQPDTSARPSATSTTTRTSGGP